MKLKKSTIVLIVLAVIFLGLSVVSTKYSVTRTITAIDEIGDMKLNDDCIDRFKKAAEYYQAFVFRIGSITRCSVLYHRH